MNFEDARKKLEALVAKMEAGGLSLDEMIKLYEEGGRLVKTCQQELKSVEQRIEKVTKAGTVEELKA